MNTAAILPQLQRAQALLQSGQAAQAWMVLAPLRAKIGDDGQALRLYALVAQANGQVDEALWALESIASLERNPPEIIGATADLLGKAGRHAEAMRLWDQLAAAHPQLADAHLNRAINASDCGMHDLAIEAAETGLAHFPGHARLLATRAMALKNAGRVQDSVAAFDLAISADPNRALTRQNQGVALRMACRFDDACDAFAEAERLGMRGAQIYANWAAAALEGGNVDRAAALYRKALSEDPAHQESLRGLTRLQIEYRGGEDAFSHYGDSVAARGDASAWIDWLNELVANRRFEESKAVGERALRQFPDDPTIAALMIYSAGVTGDATAALGQLKNFPGSDSWISLIRIKAELALIASQAELAAEMAERLTKLDPNGQLGWSLLSIAWRLLDDPREDWLCDYDRLVMVTEVPSPDGSQEPRDFARTVAAALDPLHQANAAPGNQSLREGTQTSGNLFDWPIPVIQQFREGVVRAAAAMIAGLPDDPRHPFLRRKSPNLGFSGSWSVRLKGGGGHHVPHFHNEGWMSSAYYARLPEANGNAVGPHEGWIQFGLPPAMFRLDLAPRRLVEPQEGRLVLFPSYMWHGTVPFGAGDRLTAAFDYLPL